jgi:hypothetical protein
MYPHTVVKDGLYCSLRTISEGYAFEPSESFRTE